MRRHPQGDAVLPACGGPAAAGPARHDDGQRAGPEGRHQPVRGIAGGRREEIGGSGVGQVNDQRVADRSALGRINARDSGIVVGTSPQAIDRFGGKGHQLAGCQFGGG